jgi:hypothetical protein
MVKPNYVTYEVAKLLKEKGCLETNKMRFHFLSDSMTHFPYPGKEEVIYTLEHWQVIEWLETNFKIFIDTKCINSYRCDNFGYTIHKDNDDIKIKNGFTTRKKAYDDAFKYILTEII